MDLGRTVVQERQTVSYILFSTNINQPTSFELSSFLMLRIEAFYVKFKENNSKDVGFIQNNVKENI